jgi:hypothetical protein
MFKLSFDEFIETIPDKNIKEKLKKINLPENNFFGYTIWKDTGRIRINTKAKCSRENFECIKKHLDIDSNNHTFYYKENNICIKFILSGKKSLKENRNSLGKELADNCELATIHSITNDIIIPTDTNIELFYDENVFIDWLPTFKYTKDVINYFIPNIEEYEIIHYNTDTSEFNEIIKTFCRNMKINKDSWNPADIFIIKNKEKVQRELLTALKSENNPETFNNKIYSLYKRKLLFPFALKQIISDKASFSVKNSPDKKLKCLDIEIDNFNINLSENKDEIGVFSFLNKTENKYIKMQTKGYPHKFSVSQTEIISDGTLTGGRLGKVPTRFVDSVMNEYNDTRISSINYFGDNFNIDMDELKKWYDLVYSHNKVTINNPIGFFELIELLEKSKNDEYLKNKMCHKIQGLKMAYFYLNNENNISYIMNKILSGSKKVSKDNGFFIAVY